MRCDKKTRICRTFTHEVFAAGNLWTMAFVFIVQTYLRSSIWIKNNMSFAHEYNNLRTNTISKANTTALVPLFIDRIIIVFMRLPLLYCVTLTSVFTPTTHIIPCFIISPYMNAVSCLAENCSRKQVITS